MWKKSVTITLKSLTIIEQRKYRTFTAGIKYMYGFIDEKKEILVHEKISFEIITAQKIGEKNMLTREIVFWFRKSMFSHLFFMLCIF